MKILQVTDSYFPATGGLERAIESLAAGLHSHGDEVSVATMSYPGAPETESRDGVAIRRLAGWTRHLQRFSHDSVHFFHPTVPDPALTRRLQSIVDSERPDIVHAHGWILNSCLTLRLPADCALVVTLHDYGLTCAKKSLTHFDHLDTPCAGASLRRCIPCARSAYGTLKGTALVLGLGESRRRWDRVDMFLPISAAVAEAGLAGIDRQRISVIPSFVPDSVAAPTPDAVTGSTPDSIPGPVAVEPAVRERPDFLPAGEFVIFVGALGRHKGVDTLLQAHRRMRTDIPLVILGVPRGEDLDLSGTPGREVIVRSGVAHEQIMAAVSCAAVAVVPSRWPEPLGLVAIEAMCAGIPVVASDVGGLAELVSAEVGVLVAPGDAGALAEAIDRLLDEPAIRARLGAAGRVRARDYTESAVVPRVRDAYARALVNRLHRDRSGPSAPVRQPDGGQAGGGAIPYLASTPRDGSPGLMS